MSLKLYYFNLSPPSRFVHLILSAGNIPFDTNVVDVLKGEQHSAEFARLNPNKTIPTLVDGDLVLWESHAIAKYICDKYANKVPAHWYPRNNPAARAMVDQWLDWKNNVLMPPLLDVFRPPVFGTKLHPEEKVHQDLTESARRKLNAALDVLENQLAKGNAYVAGSEISLADTAIHIFLLQLTLVMPEEDVLGGRRHLSSWYNDLPATVPHWNEVNAAFYAFRDSKK